MFNSKRQNEWQQRKVASAPKGEKEKSTTDTLHLCGCCPAGGIEPVKSRRVKEEGGRNGEQELRSCLKKAAHAWCVKGFNKSRVWTRVPVPLRARWPCPPPAEFRVHASKLESSNFCVMGTDFRRKGVGGVKINLSTIQCSSKKTTTTT